MSNQVKYEVASVDDVEAHIVIGGAKRHSGGETEMTAGINANRRISNSTIVKNSDPAGDALAVKRRESASKIAVTDDSFVKFSVAQLPRGS